jgi:tetratricopeptide (TPR) repeat protein
MLVITALILIIAALAIIFAIVVKKFPALAILDVASVPGEKEAKFKEKIIKARVDRDVARVSGWCGRIWLAFTKRLTAILQSQQAYLKKIKHNYTANLKLPASEKQQRIRTLVLQAKEAAKKEDNNTAEENLLEIIGLDRKNLEAFAQLAGLYAAQKKWPEARETYEYALKLARHRDSSTASEIVSQELYFALAGVEKEAEDLAAALENIQEALELEPNSPRYLDLIIDLSIMRKDKDLAQTYLAKLAAVNPENQKLGDWQNRIENL